MEVGETGRTEQLQGLRLIRFEEIYERAAKRQLSRSEAAEILGMPERTFRRWRGRFEADGAEGLYGRRLDFHAYAQWLAERRLAEQKKSRDNI